MKKSKLTKTQEDNYFIKGRGTPKGCEYCLKGLKAVLFLNGICQLPDHCNWYCPISEERRGRDIMFIDEIQIRELNEILEEINIIGAKGMSITGGEPLHPLNVNKTIDVIKYVKKEKGKKFHIHLYTNGVNFDESIANKLADAGLDEIRFHPQKDNWSIIKHALNKGITVGAEVPVIPDEGHIQSLEQFIRYLDDIGVSFINLNEFEYCYPNSEAMSERGFRLEEGSIATVKKSAETAEMIINKLLPVTSLKMHFCSIRAKDHYQLKNRYLRRAKTIKKPFEIITEEGLLVYGVIEGNNEAILKFSDFLKEEIQLPNDLFEVDIDAIKLPYDFILKEELKPIFNEFNLKGYIVEIIPFRGKYCQITEKTPIELFK